jgi:2-polyprenyl-3-methyl-5-hydroxy-6-metoxy-1,4-benzoquinol methylase
MDKAGMEYWDKVWSGGSLPPPVQVDPPNRHNYLERCFDAIFARYLGGRSGARLVEVGCARSVMLPFMALRYQVKVSGIDYSHLGCEQSRQILRAGNIDGTIFEADLFNPPRELLNSFDFVTSFGVAEHFDAVSKCLQAMGQLLKPGGLIITFVPNLAGVLGPLQIFANREIYGIHQILTARTLQSEHERAGFTVLEARSLGALNFCLLNWGAGSGLKARLGRKVSSAITKFSWTMLPQSSVSWRPGPFSSHLACVARKPVGSEQE